MIKLMVICQAFRLPFMFKRWRELTKAFPDIDVTLIGPSTWENRQFGKLDTTACISLEEDRFRIIPVDMVEKKGCGWWDAPSVSGIIKTISPNIIYLIGVEVSDILFRVAYDRLRYAPKAKICGFTMRGLDLPYKRIVLNSGLGTAKDSILYRTRCKLASAIYDAYFTHYPRGVEVLRNQNKFKKPIYMQTQVGVDSSIFKPDEQARRKMRFKLGLGDEFVFGSLSRIDLRKGLLEILDVLPIGGNTKFVMIGDGPDMPCIEHEVKKRGLQDYVLLPGYIRHHEPVAEILNALDAFVHIPQILPNHLDTFPLVVAEAMAVGLPVIGADSGGVSYQLGSEGKIVPLGDRDALRNAMLEIASNRQQSKEMGERLRKRLLASFEMKHLNRCMYHIINDISKGINNPKHYDQQNFTV